MSQQITVKSALTLIRRKINKGEIFIEPDFEKINFLLKYHADHEDCQEELRNLYLYLTEKSTAQECNKVESGIRILLQLHKQILGIPGPELVTVGVEDE
ncbi:MAG TPA: hypothetical protein VMD74_00495 [Candidatus Methylomirabilis sp.]|nr:hypothetical protein [Candidatus Methylomirabilis sp.]